MEKENMQKQSNTDLIPKESKPNEAGSVSIQGHIKIFDPNTKEVFINKRS